MKKHLKAKAKGKVLGNTKYDYSGWSPGERERAGGDAAEERRAAEERDAERREEREREREWQKQWREDTLREREPKDYWNKY